MEANISMQPMFGCVIFVWHNRGICKCIVCTLQQECMIKKAENMISMHLVPNPSQEKTQAGRAARSLISGAHTMTRRAPPRTAVVNLPTFIAIRILVGPSISCHKTARGIPNYTILISLSKAFSVGA